MLGFLRGATRFIRVFHESFEAEVDVAVHPPIRDIAREGVIHEIRGEPELRFVPQGERVAPVLIEPLGDGHIAKPPIIVRRSPFVPLSSKDIPWRPRSRAPSHRRKSGLDKRPDIPLQAIVIERLYVIDKREAAVHAGDHGIIDP